MTHIKTAEERFQAYLKAKGIPSKSALLHVHKITQFEEHERKELRAARESNDSLKALEERDFWEDRATTLAEKVGEYFDVPVGEHANYNCPISEAIKILDGEYVTKFDKELEQAQNEDEEFFYLHDENKSFATEREAIDAAMSFMPPTPEGEKP